MNAKHFCLSIIACVAIAALSVHAQDSLNASDNAGNYTSPNTWPQTANEGTGFGSWSYANSTPDGGYAGEFLGNSAGDGIGQTENINSSANSDSWGFYANQGTYAIASAILPFTGSLGTFQTFSIQMQNGYIATGATNGFSLQNSSGADLFSFYFVGGQDDYTIDINGNYVTTTVPFTDNGLTLSFEQLTGDNWIFSITLIGGSTTTYTSSGTGDLLSSATISQVDMYNEAGTSDVTENTGNYDLFFNNATIVPEPSTLALFGLSGLATLIAIRRRK